MLWKWIIKRYEHDFVTWSFRFINVHSDSHLGNPSGDPEALYISADRNLTLTGPFPFFLTLALLQRPQFFPSLCFSNLKALATEIVSNPHSKQKNEEIRARTKVHWCSFLSWCCHSNTNTVDDEDCTWNKTKKKLALHNFQITSRRAFFEQLKEFYCFSFLLVARLKLGRSSDSNSRE